MNRKKKKKHDNDLTFLKRQQTNLNFDKRKFLKKLMFEIKNM